MEEKPCATPDASPQVHLDGVGGDAKPFGDFLVAQVLLETKQHDLATALRQIVEGFGQYLLTQALIEDFADLGRLFQDGELLALAYLHVFVPGLAARQIDRGVVGGRKEKCPGVFDGAALLRAQDAGVGFLHDVVLFPEPGKTRRQIGAHRWFVRLQFLSEPLEFFRGRHRIGDADAPLFLQCEPRPSGEARKAQSHEISVDFAATRIPDSGV